MLDTSHKSPNSNERIVNEVCIAICTVNGSGSATTNNILYRVVPHGDLTSGKNIFPSNIKVCPPGLSSVLQLGVHRAVSS